MGVHGTPVPESYDCLDTVHGSMDDANSDEPDFFCCFVFDDTSTDPSSIPPATWKLWVVNHTYDPADATFVLTGLHKDSPLSGSVLVAVWCVYDNGDEKGPGSKQFQCGSGAGNAALGGGQSAGVTPQQVADTAPLQCTVDVSGFGPSVLTAFNRVWKLANRGAMSGLLWDNGGDGSREPRVELATERPFGTPWQLTFRLGEIVVSYTKSAEEWRALAANTFRSVSSSGVERDATLPASVTVVPA